MNSGVGGYSKMPLFAVQFVFTINLSVLMIGGFEIYHGWSSFLLHFHEPLCKNRRSCEKIMVFFAENRRYNLNIKTSQRLRKEVNRYEESYRHDPRRHHDPHFAPVRFCRYRSAADHSFLYGLRKLCCYDPFRAVFLGE